MIPYQSIPLESWYKVKGNLKKNVLMAINEKIERHN